MAIMRLNMIKSPAPEIKSLHRTAIDLGAPATVWTMVSNYLTNASDYNHFIRTCRLFLFAGTQRLTTHMESPATMPSTPICISLYHRLCAIDDSLPVNLSSENPIIEYLEALARVQKSQEQEIIYLCSHHPALVKKYYIAHDLLPLSPLARLERTHQMLDTINTNIITSADSFGNRALILENFGLTRFPKSLLLNPQYRGYFQHLKTLNCSNNFIQTMVLQNLPCLKTIEIEASNLHYLQMSNLPRLRYIRIPDNQLTGTLDLTPFPLLVSIHVHNNKLNRIMLIGLQFLEFLDCSYNELTELTVDSPMIHDLNCMMNSLQNLTVVHLTHLMGHTDDSDPNTQGLSVYANPLQATFSLNLIERFGDELRRQLHYDNLSTGIDADISTNQVLDNEFFKIDSPAPDIDFASLSAEHRRNYEMAMASFRSQNDHQTNKRSRSPK